MIRKVLIFITLALLPLAFLVIGISFNRTWFSGDPEYAYLLNGINILSFHPVGHADNPGTPVQSYSAVVLGISHLFRMDKASSLQVDVLTHPEVYVEIERKVSVIINALMMIVLGIWSFYILKSLWFSLILQIIPFISTTVLETAFTKVSPEPVLVFTTSLFIILLLKFYLNQGKEEAKYSKLFGWISGFGIATKATFLPIALIPLWILKGRQNWKTFILQICISFVFFTIPAIPQYPHIAKWFAMLFVHTGTYGEGGLGIVNLPDYFRNLTLILANNPGMSISLVCTLLFIGVSYASKQLQASTKSVHFRFMSGIAFSQLMGILMVAKHYHANHYMVPEICLTGVIWIFAILQLSSTLRKQNSIRKFIAPACFVLFVFISILNYSYINRAFKGYIISNEEYCKVSDALEKEYPQYAKAYYYPVSINPYCALRWGSVYSNQVHLNKLRSLYPEGLFYDCRNHSFQSWETGLNAKSILAISKGKLLLVGGPMTNSELSEAERGGLALKQLYKGRLQAFYEVDLVNSPMFKQKD
ncbi:MAG: hypothetical protein HXX13_08100 [Bacteroidetes bacterium]|nr:hypothetical protein [Bacteroidota bacterium]